MMGFEKNAIKAGSLDVGKSNNGRKSKDGKEKKERGCCWAKFSCIGTCIPSRSKIDNSISATSTHHGDFLPISRLILFTAFSNFLFVQNLFILV